MPYSSLSSTAHSTEAEFEFISNLGTGKYCRPNHSQAWQLKRYLELFHLREDWGRVDRDKCKEFATELLKQIGG